MNIGHDSNGNRILKVGKSDLGGARGFSIQTLGNLPITHRDGIVAGTDRELRGYIFAHGTERQKFLFGM